MKIGIIGAGNIGGELVRKFRGQGHTVRVSNSRGPESLKEIADETGAIASTTEEVVLDSELIIVSIIQKAIPSLAEIFAKIPPNVIVIDTGNYYSFRDGNIRELDDGLVHSEWVSSHLGHPVLKAFNSLITESLVHKAFPPGHPDRFALPVAGDDAAHKKVVIDLINNIGFDAIDAGSLGESWRQQPGSPAYCTDYNLATLPSKLQSAVREELTIRCELVMSRLMTSAKDAPTGVSVAWLRTESEEPFDSVVTAHSAESLWLKK